MKVEIIDDFDGVANSGRIVEVLDGELVTDSCFICDGPPKLKSSTSKLRYCCDSHRLLQQPEDSEEPFPLEVMFKPNIGRYLVAARDIQKGELIFSEEPLAMGPNHSSLPTCLECMKPISTDYRCPNCNLPVCEEMCAYGEEHSKECKIFQQLPEKLNIKDLNLNSPIYWTITVIRALSLKEDEPEKYRIIERMMDHNSDHAKDEENWKLYHENVIDFLRDRCNMKQIPEEEIFHILGVLDVNSVAIHASAMVDASSSSNAKPGHALFALTSLMSHNCVSNTKTIIRSDYSCECRATTFIPAGEEITKQYVNALETTFMRRAKLRAGWYFDCNCQRCVDPTELESFVSATRCLRCGDGRILPNNPLDNEDSAVWKCDECGFSTSLEAVKKLVDYLLSKFSDPYVNSSVDNLEDLLEKGVKLLHPHHYVNNLIRIRLNSSYVRLAHRMFRDNNSSDRNFDIPTEVYLRRKELLDDIHRTIEILEPGLSRRRGLSLFETSTCHLQLGRQLFESDRFSKMDFVVLIQTEMESLTESIECLQSSRDGTTEALVHYQAQGALYEAECTLRVLLQSNKANQESGAGKSQSEAKQQSEEESQQSESQQESQPKSKEAVLDSKEENPAKEPKVSEEGAKENPPAKKNEKESKNVQKGPEKNKKKKK